MISEIRFGFASDFGGMTGNPEVIDTQNKCATIFSFAPVALEGAGHENDP
jgi:hypothetical protein